MRRRGSRFRASIVTSPGQSPTCPSSRVSGRVAAVSAHSLCARNATVPRLSLVVRQSPCSRRSLYISGEVCVLGFSITAPKANTFNRRTGKQHSKTGRLTASARRRQQSGGRTSAVSRPAPDQKTRVRRRIGRRRRPVPRRFSGQCLSRPKVAASDSFVPHYVAVVLRCPRGSAETESVRG